MRKNFNGGSVWEPLRGYSRAVQVGDSLFVSGTTAINDKGEVLFAGDPYQQTKYVIERIRGVLLAADFKLEDVVRTRLFVTQLNRWEDYARAHREVFEAIRPASSIVQVVRLVDARLMIEMEVDAIRGAGKAEALQIQMVSAG
jgi:enamine deaminase RidA (YjgF/YER057c/UK114 family)